VLVGRINRPPARLKLNYDRVLEALRRQMTLATFDAWVRPTRLHHYNGNGRVIVAADNATALDWLTNRLAEVFNRALSAEIGHPVKVEFVLAPSSKE